MVNHQLTPGYQLNHENAPSTVSLWPGPFLSINVAKVCPSSKLQDASKALLVHLPDPQVAKSLLVRSVAAFGRLRLRSFGRAVPVAGPCGWLGRWSLGPLSGDSVADLRTTRNLKTTNI